MVLNDNVEDIGEVENSVVGKVKSHTPLHISTSLRDTINDENSQNGALSKRLGSFKLGNLASPSLRFQQFAEKRDEVSRSIPSSTTHHIRERFVRIFSRKFDGDCVWRMCKEWISDPMNLALFIWIFCVAVSGAILFMVMTGMLNHCIPNKSKRDVWFEVNNQILNALFTLMCLYQHPKRIHHFILLLRWKPEDVSKLRKIYCKDGMYKPNEWAHMMVVVSLLNINCFSQYALCALNLGYTRSKRPPIGVGICISFAIGAPAFASIYSMITPLGKDYENDPDEEAQVPSTTRRQSLEKRFSFSWKEENETTVGTAPRWSGGILDFWDDISLAYLSLFCSFCVFGWNMERLGFGNMYVHIATFLLFCTAPFWILNLAAVNIENDTIREALGITGILLCVFGLLYGGFWRIQIRKRFNLPSYSFCYCKPAVTDFAVWMFCCWCTLAQEVRTANSYDIVEDKLCLKKTDETMTPPPPLVICRE